MKKFIAQCKKCGATEFEVKRKIYFFENTFWEKLCFIGERNYDEIYYCPNCGIKFNGDLIELVNTGEFSG